MNITNARILKKLSFFFVLLFTCHLTVAQSQWQDGAFNTRTGKQISNDQWNELLPREFDLFQNDEVLEIVLESDFKQFIRDKNKDQYQEALLHFPLNDTTVVKRVVRIKPRGQFRKKYCSVPPIKLNFKHTEIYVTSIQQLEKMKVVSECKNQYHYEEYVLREYLTYKLYQLFSDLSFKVKLLHLTTIDFGSKKKKTNTSFAFLIEEADDLAKRSDMQYLKVETATHKNIVESNMALIAIFHYMIGNTDWSIAGAHNFKLMKEKDPLQDKALAVPYDFDYSGLVNAPYAVPPDNFGIDNVRTRLLRCPCYSKEIFKQTLDIFKSKKSQVMGIISGFPHLSESAKKDITNFINGFYRQIESKDGVNFFLKNCGKLL
jgi:hypothetical protein